MDIFNLDAEPEVRARKIVQIAVGKQALMALTEDGDVWSLGNVSGRWHKLPPLPAEDDGREAGS